MRHRWGVGSLGDTGRCEARARQRSTAPRDAAARLLILCYQILSRLHDHTHSTRRLWRHRATLATAYTVKPYELRHAHVKLRLSTERPGARPGAPLAHWVVPPGSTAPAWAMQQLLGNSPLSEAAPRRALPAHGAHDHGPWTNVVHTARAAVCPRFVRPPAAARGRREDSVGERGETERCLGGPHTHDTHHSNSGSQSAVFFSCLGFLTHTDTPPI